MRFGKPLPRRGRRLDVRLDLGTRVERRSGCCRHCGRHRRGRLRDHQRRHDGRFRRIELDLVRPFLRGVDAGDRALGCCLRGAILGLQRRGAGPHPIRDEQQRDQHAPDVHKIPSDGHHVYVPCIRDNVTTKQMRADAFVPNDHNTCTTSHSSTRFVAGSTVCHRGHDKVTLCSPRCSKLERRLVCHVGREGWPALSRRSPS